MLPCERHKIARERSRHRQQKDVKEDSDRSAVLYVVDVRIRMGHTFVPICFDYVYVNGGNIGFLRRGKLSGGITEQKIAEVDRISYS